MTYRLLKPFIPLVLALLLAPAAYAQPGVISTVAGTGTASFNGTGIAATSAHLNLPNHVFVDGAGNIFVGDRANHRIRKVDAATGLISTVAGTGVAGFNGDGIPATSAQLNTVFGGAVFVDGAGNLFIGESGNHRIRKVDAATGLISTVAGTGVQGFNGDGIPATSAQLKSPRSVFVDGSGNIFIGDTINHCVRKVDAATGLISTVAGTCGVQGFNGNGIPATSALMKIVTGVFVDGAGNIFIADNNNQRIRKVDAATGLISTVAGTGVGGAFNGDGIAATSANLLFPSTMAVDGAGNIFITDTGHDRLRKVDAATGLISTVAGTGVRSYNGDGIPATSAHLAAPAGVFVDGSGSIFIADILNHRIRKVGAAAPANQPPDCTNAAIADQSADATCSATIAGTDVTGITDPDGDPLSITVSPATLALGPNTVTVSADDGNGGSCSIDITVNVVDDTPPQITCPDDATLNADGTCQATYPGPAATATDNCDASPSVSSAPPLPALFAGLSPNTITYTATDAAGNVSMCPQTVTVIDVTPPEVTAALILVPGDDDDDDGDDDGDGNRFEVACTATDNCDDLTVTSVIVTPLDNPTVKFKTRNKKKLTFNLGKNKVAVQGPDPQALWDAVEAAGGVEVANGQVLSLNSGGGDDDDDDGGGRVVYKFDNQGALVSVDGGDPAVLRCTATDASGNVGTAEASSPAPPGDDDDGDEGADKRHAGKEAAAAQAEVPSEYVLEGNYPNPFNPQTTIRFGVPASAVVRLVVYDVLGRQVRVLVEGMREAGTHEVVFEANGLPSGTYLARLETPAGSFVQMMQLVK